ncbi:FluC/FEX family fluoride channel [Lacticaseibacillus thailandensis]|uniref:FluC/FEX family fluoride channel n=1 Tax=Lacticaseibacillus thailandensis TaxID=381741 RepID=UPI000A6F3CF0
MDEIRIALFGFVGGLLRYMVIGYFINHSTVLGTLIINLIGCFGLGLVNHFFSVTRENPCYYHFIHWNGTYRCLYNFLNIYL